MDHSQNSYGTWAAARIHKVPSWCDEPLARSWSPAREYGKRTSDLNLDGMSYQDHFLHYDTQLTDRLLMRRVLSRRSGGVSHAVAAAERSAAIARTMSMNKKLAHAAAPDSACSTQSPVGVTQDSSAPTSDSRAEAGLKGSAKRSTTSLQNGSESIPSAVDSPLWFSSSSPESMVSATKSTVPSSPAAKKSPSAPSILSASSPDILRGSRSNSTSATRSGSGNDSESAGAGIRRRRAQSSQSPSRPLPQRQALGAAASPLRGWFGELGPPGTSALAASGDVCANPVRAERLLDARGHPEIAVPLRAADFRAETEWLLSLRSNQPQAFDLTPTQSIGAATLLRVPFPRRLSGYTAHN